MIARVEKSFYGAQALLELVSDTEPFSDSSASSDHISSHASSVTHDHSSVTNGANHPTPRGLSRAPARATDADRSDTDSEPVRRQGAKTKKRRRDSSTDSDLTNKSVTAGSKRRKTSEALIPELEICWGSIATRRPDGDHRHGRCNCPSHETTFSREGQMEPARGKEQDTVLQMYSPHFHSHTFIPNQNGTHKTSEQLHRDSATEMHIWCRSRNYFRLWA